MIKTYLFDSFYSKFSSMNSLKTFFSIILLVGVSFAQSARDMEAENPASDNWQENYRSIEAGKSKVNIYSNAAVADIFVWNYTWLSTERTFPAIISLPTDNKVYTISLYTQSQFQYLTNELQNFDFEGRDISEFELLQDEFERMKLGTKNVRPIPGTSESIFLTYCDSDDANCEQGMHWLDQFYAKYYDSKQEQVLVSDLNGSDLTDSEKALVRRHRVGVAGMLSAFTIAIFLIDNSAL
jgi:hypothetical protein|tara:strand:+ start:138 stop:854 length:717 start_codon:yes stop_codon:yes gene_type:complete